MNINNAKQAEKNDQWRKAEQIYKLLGKDADAIACQMIADANERGDEYRRLIGAEPNKSTHPCEWATWYENMTQTYNKMFRS